MPQKYVIKKQGYNSDPLCEKHFFSRKWIHLNYNGTRDGRFYSKEAAVRCLKEAYYHYLSRYEEGLSKSKPLMLENALLINMCLYMVVKAPEPCPNCHS